MTKTCCSCKTEKSIEEFSKAANRKDGLQTCCKTCVKCYDKKRYEADPQLWKETTKANRRKLMKEIADLKALRGCIICEERTPCCLDFHHLDSETKEGHVADLINKGCRNLGLKEIEKCVVICSNHHRKFHAGLITLPKLVAMAEVASAIPHFQGG